MQTQPLINVAALIPAAIEAHQTAQREMDQRVQAARGQAYAAGKQMVRSAAEWALGLSLEDADIVVTLSHENSPHVNIRSCGFVLQVPDAGTIRLLVGNNVLTATAPERVPPIDEPFVVESRADLGQFIELMKRTREDTGADAKRITNETPTGALNGVNKTFEVSHTVKIGSSEVYLNGQRLRPGVKGDYYEVGKNEIVLTFPPAKTDVVLVDYVIA